MSIKALPWYCEEEFLVTVCTHDDYTENGILWRDKKQSMQSHPCARPSDVLPDTLFDSYTSLKFSFHTTVPSFSTFSLIRNKDA